MIAEPPIIATARWLIDNVSHQLGGLFTRRPSVIKKVTERIFDRRQYVFNAFCGIHYEMLTRGNFSYRHKLLPLAEVHFFSRVRWPSAFAGSLP